jgi:hypothetical protein
VRAVRSEPAGRSATCVAKSCSNARSNPGGIRRHVAAPGGLKRGRGEPKRPLAARFEPSATTVQDREVPGSNPGPRPKSEFRLVKPATLTVKGRLCSVVARIRGSDISS